MGEKSVRSDESGEVKRKILLRAVHSAVREDSPVVLCNASYSEFQILDLDTGKFTKTRYTLLGDAGVGTLVSLGSVIYTLGKPRSYLIHPDPDYSEYYSHIKGEDDIVTVHEGLSFFDYLADPERAPVPEWKKGPLVKEDQYYPNCVALLGKLYVFTTTCFGEVYDPKVNCWHPLPKPRPFLEMKKKYQVSPPLVSDPLHGRILLHVEFSPSLESSIYAYYPADDHWDCLVANFDGNWVGPLALVDGVIYFYARKCNPLLRAYDLHSKQWLEVVFSSQFDKDYSRCHFDALHHLGNGLMCFTTYSYKLRNFDPNALKDHTVLLSVQFKVQRAHRAHQVLLTPLSSLSSPLESFCQIYGQIAL